MNSIVCGRLDDNINISAILGEPQRRRIFSEGFNRLKQPSYYPIATDGKVVLDKSGFTGVDSFFSSFKAGVQKTLIVLTIKERALLIEQEAFFDLRVRVLEVDYPFVEVRCFKALHANYEVLQKWLKKIETMDICGGSFAKDQTVRNLHLIARKLRFKNNFDQNFFFAAGEAYQEVFKFKEERLDRVVVAFDFNSMYADCMLGKFCKPDSVEHVKFEGAKKDVDNLDEGIYRVTLHGGIPCYFLEKHPFTYKKLGKSYRFNLFPDESVEIWLFREEVEYYGKFFSKVEIHEGFVSSKTVRHPLARIAQAHYRARRLAKERGDAVLERRYKLALQLMHSATNRRIFKEKHFGSLADAYLFLSCEFKLNLKNLQFGSISRFLISNKYFSISRKCGVLVVKYMDLRSDSLLFVFSSKILAMARLKLMKVIERFVGEGAEICYANVDSLHISIPKAELSEFLSRSSDLISSDMGFLKIQAIAEQGYWFDVGRYWLTSNEKVVMFKNVGFNSLGATSAFTTTKKIRRFSKTETFAYLSSYRVDIGNCFSWKKRVSAIKYVDSIDYERYAFSEIATPESAQRTEAEEIIKSKREKLELLRSIIHRYENQPNVCASGNTDIG